MLSTYCVRSWRAICLRQLSCLLCSSLEITNRYDIGFVRLNFHFRNPPPPAKNNHFSRDNFRYPRFWPRQPFIRVFCRLTCDWLPPVALELPAKTRNCSYSHCMPQFRSAVPVLVGQVLVGLSVTVKYPSSVTVNYDFYRAVLCVARTMPSQDVRPSVRHTPVFYRNE